jgi:outer membrane biosynthesis protein TonB
VISTRIAMKSGDAKFDQAVVEAARASTYAPATRNCVGVPSTYLFQAKAQPQQ